MERITTFYAIDVWRKAAPAARFDVATARGAADASFGTNRTRAPTVVGSSNPAH
jgi:hypothetical protein